MRVVALLTCHNRRDTTLECLESLYRTWPDKVDLEVVLVDDGSTDGTSEAVGAAFPNVHVIEGSGDLFWCKGMHRAWTYAAKIEAEADLWVNDDVVVRGDSLERLMDLHEVRVASGAPPAILVGTMVDPITEAPTYGGLLSASTWHPGRFSTVGVVREPTHVNTFNGNLVLVPRAVSDRVGLIDSAYSHATGDIDYGLRAERSDVDVIVLPGVAGTCTRNPMVRHSFRSFLGRKGLPWRDWLRFTRRFTPWKLWPLTFVSPYVKFAASEVRSKQHNVARPGK